MAHLIAVFCGRSAGAVALPTTPLVCHHCCSLCCCGLWNSNQPLHLVAKVLAKAVPQAAAYFCKRLLSLPCLRLCHSCPPLLLRGTQLLLRRCCSRCAGGCKLGSGRGVSLVAKAVGCHRGAPNRADR